MPTTRTGQPTARFVVQVMDDCWPVFDVGGDPPAADSITDAAARVLTDRMDVWSALRTEAAAGTLLAALLAHGRDGVEVSAPTTISPQSGGGLMGSRIEVYAHLLRAAESGS